MLTVAATVVLGCAGLVDALAFFDARADENAALTPLDRAYGYHPDGLMIVPDQSVVEHAVRTMPNDASYRVVLGQRFRSILRIPWSRSVEEDFLRQYLLPRRQRDTGPWVFCFDCDADTWGGRFVIMAEGPGGLAFGRLRP